MVLLMLISGFEELMFAKNYLIKHAYFASYCWQGLHVCASLWTERGTMFCACLSSYLLPPLQCFCPSLVLSLRVLCFRNVFMRGKARAVLVIEASRERLFTSATERRNRLPKKPMRSAKQICKPPLSVQVAIHTWPPWLTNTEALNYTAITAYYGYLLSRHARADNVPH